MGMSLFSTSKHFSLKELANGVVAAIATDGGAAICNAGVVDLGGQLLVFDTFLTPQAAQDLRIFTIAEFGTPPHLVINSHYHNDHTWGNQVFAADAQIISTIRTRELMETEGKEEFKWCSANAYQKLQEQRIKSKEAEGSDLYETVGMLGYYEGLFEAMPILRPCKPGITFECSMEFAGSKRSCTLTAFEGGHSGSDAILYLPKEGIVFMGDLLFTHFHPYLSEGDPHKLLQALQAIEKLNARTFIPGHGPIGTKQDLTRMIAYGEHILQMATGLAHAGADLEAQVNQLEIPPEYQDWQMRHLYRTNITHFAKLAAKQ